MSKILLLLSKKVILGIQIGKFKGFVMHCNLRYAAIKFSHGRWVSNSVEIQVNQCVKSKIVVQQVQFRFFWGKYVTPHAV